MDWKRGILRIEISDAILHERGYAQSCSTIVVYQGFEEAPVSQ